MVYTNFISGLEPELCPYNVIEECDREVMMYARTLVGLLNSTVQPDGTHYGKPAHEIHKLLDMSNLHDELSY